MIFVAGFTMQLFLRRLVLAGLLLVFCSFGVASAQRVIFAHFMLANQDYVAANAPTEVVIGSFQRDIREAQAVGIDGFALNAGGWFEEPRYIKRAAEMFEAAYLLNSNFKLIFSADMCCSNDAEDVEDMVRRFANSSRYAALYYKRDGRYLLTTFAGAKQGPDFWRQLRNDLEQGTHPSIRNAPDTLAYVSGVPSSRPLPVSLVPAFFWGGELPQASDIASGLSEYSKVIDGAFYWGIAGVPGLGHAPDQMPSADSYAAVLHAAGKLYMAPICFQFWGANAGRYYEYGGYAGMIRMWMDAINVSHPEMLEIITWNDFIEGTYVSPIDDPGGHPDANDLGASAAPPSTIHYFHTHRGATELLAHFIEWYKTGEEPSIKTDSVFWAYRTVLSLPYKSKLYGSAKDVIYITTHLTATSELKVLVGGESKTIMVPAGLCDLEVPMVAGAAPRFELWRKGIRIAQAEGVDTITVNGSYADLYYSTGAMHE